MKSFIVTFLQISCVILGVFAIAAIMNSVANTDERYQQEYLRSE